MEQFIKADLTTEEAFWVMWYFLKEHYDLSGGTFDVSDILSASQPVEFDSNGHFDGKILGNRTIAPADSGMVSFWNAAVQKYKKDGLPPAKNL